MSCTSSTLLLIRSFGGEIDDLAQNGEASDKVFFDAVFISCCSGIHLMRNTTGWCGDDDEQQKYSKKKNMINTTSARVFIDMQKKTSTE